jgi:hypothetical protein
MMHGGSGSKPNPKRMQMCLRHLMKLHAKILPLQTSWNFHARTMGGLDRLQFSQENLSKPQVYADQDVSSQQLPSQTPLSQPAVASQVPAVAPTSQSTPAHTSPSQPIITSQVATTLIDSNTTSTFSGIYGHQ